jgi:TM2 domain-containing membrane protein YozV
MGISNKVGLTAEQLMMVESEVKNKGKSKGIAYLFWFFLGSLGAHRFYTGDIGYAIGMFVVWIISWFLLFIPIGIWVIVDAFLLSKRIDDLNEKVEMEAIQKVRAINTGN